MNRDQALALAARTGIAIQPPTELTDRERRALVRLVQGVRPLMLSPVLRRKLGGGTDTDLARIALEEGYIGMEDLT